MQRKNHKDLSEANTMEPSISQQWRVQIQQKEFLSYEGFGPKVFVLTRWT